MPAVPCETSKLILAVWDRHVMSIDLPAHFVIFPFITMLVPLGMPLQVCPDSAKVRLNRGILARRELKMEEAVEHFRWGLVGGMWVDEGYEWQVPL